MLEKKKYSVISLFAWCGGLDLWFLWNFEALGKKYTQNNFNLIWSNDINSDACKSFEKNLKHKIECWDIRELIKNNSLPEKCDIVLWWFPCQDFSHAWKRRGFASERGLLYKSMIEVIQKTNPLVFLAENVKWLLTMNDGGAIRTIISDFSEIGYNVNYRLIMAADYWVPQKRERVIIVWTKKWELPVFEFSNPPIKEHQRITAEQAIWDLADLPEWEKENHFWSKAKKNKWQWNKAIYKDKVAPTMRSEHHWNIEFHWNGKRRLSAREAARIQSFPDDFIFYNSTSSAYRQIGNAVPPVVGWHLAQDIQNFLNKNIIF